MDVQSGNSYVSFNSQVLAKHNHNGSAIIFRNTGIQYNGKQGNLFRSMNVRLEEGSYITGNHTYYANDTTIYTANDNSGAVTLGDNSKVQMILFEGARFDAATYNKLVNHTGTKKDDATAAVTYYPMGSIAYPDGSSVSAEGYMYGSIIDTPRGERGFGYDPIFVPDGEGRTVAEMSDDEKNAISHRANALKALVEKI